MALIAPGCARFTLQGQYTAAHTWANIWDARILTGVDGSRATACEQYAQTIIDVWATTLAHEIDSDVVLNQVSWVDLNDEEGSTGFVTEGFLTPPNPNGDIGGDGDPPNVSVLLTKQGASARNQRNGRMYVPGIPAGGTTNGTLSTAALALWVTEAAGFLSLLTDPTTVDDTSVLPTIIHTRNDGTPTNPDIVYTGNSVITALVPQSQLATQRRRLRR